jgi:hypothetical protein
MSMMISTEDKAINAATWLVCMREANKICVTPTIELVKITNRLSDGMGGYCAIGVIDLLAGIEADVSRTKSVGLLFAVDRIHLWFTLSTKPPQVVLKWGSIIHGNDVLLKTFRQTANHLIEHHKWYFHSDVSALLADILPQMKGFDPRD